MAVLSQVFISIITLATAVTVTLHDQEPHTEYDSVFKDKELAALIGGEPLVNAGAKLMRRQQEMLVKRHIPQSFEEQQAPRSLSTDEQAALQGMKIVVAVNMPFYRFVVTGARSKSVSKSTISEFGMLNEYGELIDLANSSVVEDISIVPKSGSGSSGNEDLAWNLIDGDTRTSADISLGDELLIRMRHDVHVSGWGFKTSQRSTEYDPAGFTFEGSLDGQEWLMLADKSHYNGTSVNRGYLTGPFIISKEKVHDAVPQLDPSKIRRRTTTGTTTTSTSTSPTTSTTTSSTVPTETPGTVSGNKSTDGAGGRSSGGEEGSPGNTSTGKASTTSSRDTSSGDASTGSPSTNSSRDTSPGDALTGSPSTNSSRGADTRSADGRNRNGEDSENGTMVRNFEEELATIAQDAGLALEQLEALLDAARDISEKHQRDILSAWTAVSRIGKVPSLIQDAEALAAKVTTDVNIAVNAAADLGMSREEQRDMAAKVRASAQKKLAKVRNASMVKGFALSQPIGDVVKACSEAGLSIDQQGEVVATAFEFPQTLQRTVAAVLRASSSGAVNKSTGELALGSQKTAEAAAGAGMQQEKQQRIANAVAELSEEEQEAVMDCLDAARLGLNKSVLRRRGAGTQLKSILKSCDETGWAPARCADVVSVASQLGSEKQFVFAYLWRSISNILPKTSTSTSTTMPSTTADVTSGERSPTPSPMQIPMPSPVLNLTPSPAPIAEAMNLTPSPAPIAEANHTSSANKSIGDSGSEGAGATDFKCSEDYNFLTGIQYKQISLTDGCRNSVCNANPKYVPEYASRPSINGAVTYCQRVCKDAPEFKLTFGDGTAPCTGFFLQRHSNGHEICGFFTSDLSTAQKVRQGHAAGSQICELPYSATTTTEQSPETTTTTEQSPKDLDFMGEILTGWCSNFSEGSSLGLGEGKSSWEGEESEAWCFRKCRLDAACEQAIYEISDVSGHACLLGVNTMSSLPIPSRKHSGARCFAKQRFFTTTTTTESTTTEPPEDVGTTIIEGTVYEQTRAPTRAPTVINGTKNVTRPATGATTVEDKTEDVTTTGVGETSAPMEPATTPPMANFTVAVVPEFPSTYARRLYKELHSGEEAWGFHFKVSLVVPRLLDFIAQRTGNVLDPENLTLAVSRFQFTWPNSDCSESESGFTDFKSINYITGTFANERGTCGDLVATSVDSEGLVRFPQSGNLDLMWLAGEFGTKYAYNTGGDTLAVQIDELVIAERRGEEIKEYSICGGWDRASYVGCPKLNPLQFVYPKNNVGSAVRLCSGDATHFGQAADPNNCFKTDARM